MHAHNDYADDIARAECQRIVERMSPPERELWIRMGGIIPPRIRARWAADAANLAREQRMEARRDRIDRERRDRLEAETGETAVMIPWGTARKRRRLRKCG